MNLLKKRRRQLKQICDCGRSYYVRDGKCNKCGADRKREEDVEYNWDIEQVSKLPRGNLVGGDKKQQAYASKPKGLSSPLFDLPGGKRVEEEQIELNI